MSYKHSLAVACMAILAATSVARPHCQIPCGIYDDETRFTLLAEHISTIEKSTKEIIRLSAAPEKDYNQIVRWVNNKDAHADEFSDIITYYFMAQRVKPVEKDSTVVYQLYLHQIGLLHEMLVYAMKTKQTTEEANIEKLLSLLADFRTAYFGPQGKIEPGK